MSRSLFNRVPPPERMLGAAAPLGVLGGFTVAPAMTVAGLGGLIFPLWSWLHAAAVALILVGVVWPLLAVVVAHHKRAAAARDRRERESSRGFGAYLRSMRVARRLGIPTLVKRLAREGYSVTEDVYADFEANVCRPEHGRAFVVALAAVYRLSRSQESALGQAFGRQLLVDALGEDFVEKWFPEPSAEECVS